MTLPPERIGDKDQRFAVLIKGYPSPGWNECGYSEDEEGAHRLGKALAKAPSATEYKINDRSTTAKEPLLGERNIMNKNFWIGMAIVLSGIVAIFWLTGFLLSVLFEDITVEGLAESAGKTMLQIEKAYDKGKSKP